MLRIVDTAYGPMLAPDNDEFVGRSLSLLGEYCPSELDILRAYCGPGDTVIDVGANLGAVAIPLAKHVGKTGKVIAYEPQRTCYLAMCGSAALSGASSLVPVNAAVGEAASMIAVPDLLSYGEGRLNAGGLELGMTEVGIQTPVHVLDDIVADRVDLIKIDVEGMEPYVLRGAANLISVCLPTIFIEIDRPSHVEALKILFDAGYRVWRHIAPLYRKENHAGYPYCPWEHNYCSFDAIAVHPSRGLPDPSSPCVVEEITEAILHA